MYHNATPQTMTRKATRTNPALLPAALLALAAACPMAGAQVQYVLDTGVNTGNIGPSTFDANVTWLNAFDTQPGGEVINTISVSFGGIEDNDGNIGSDLVTLAILLDPNDDYDPTDAQLIATTTGTWKEVGYSNFIDFPIEPTRVEGVFFVAVMMDVLERANPASIDSHAPSAGTLSWYFYNPEPNLDDLGSSPYILRMSQGPFPGAWMIRATGGADAPCGADLNNDGVLNFFDVSAFLSAFAAQEPPADLNNDGVYNFFDVSTFLSLFAQGCP